MLYQPESANKLIKSKSVLCATHLLVMDGYEDLPILLSVIQSNKVNIYCIYIKNYPGIEWRRVAFIGVFPGVRSPRMRARRERQIVRERAKVPNLFKSQSLPRPSSKASCPPAFAPSFRTCGPPPGWQTWASRACGALSLSKQEEPRALTRGLTLGNLGRACD